MPHSDAQLSPAEIGRLTAITYGYDYFARIWLDGPLRPEEPILQGWLADLSAVEPSLAQRCADLVRMLDSDNERAAADEDFQGCLVIPHPGRYVPPYASAWLDGNEELWGQTTLRVLRCYGQAGLDWQGQGASDDRPWVRAPDHLGIECAFIAELSAASAQPLAGNARPAGSGGPAALAASFVVDHLRTWVPTYAAALGAHSTSSYWREAAAVLTAWVRQDGLLPSVSEPAATGSPAESGAT